MLVNFNMIERGKDLNFRISTQGDKAPWPLLLEIGDVSINLGDDDLSALNSLIGRAMAIKGIEQRKAGGKWPPSDSSTHP
jgi:hypothetical protein